MNHCQIDLGQVCRGNDREWTLGSREPKEVAFEPLFHQDSGGHLEAAGGR